MPNKEKNKKSRLVFKKRIIDTCIQKGMSIDDKLKQMIFSKSDSLYDEILGEYFTSIEILIKLAEKNDNSRCENVTDSGHPPNARSVQHILGRERENKQYKYITLYFAKKRIYDFHINGKSVIE